MANREESKEKISSGEVEKHNLLLAMETPFDFENPISVLFDGKNIATAFFHEKEKILYLHSIDLKSHGLDRKGIGRIVINYLEQYFTQFLEGKNLLFLVRYDNRNTSKEFYKKVGFRKLGKSKKFSKQDRFNICSLLDRHCSDTRILFKIVKENSSKKQ